jgi:hypothetical protein
MLLELLKPLSFLASLLSLYPVLLSAFFVPGTRWEERLAMALLRLALAGCICFTSGFLFAIPEIGGSGAHEPILRTLPVRVFFCAVSGMAVLFALTWWLDTYYVPLLRHGCCRP